ncbi:MAG: hypothetical protein KDK24_05645 [Pseudooceanicola sp.]|nr:hypothetical protein [Pseudooceanicola sp.]
MPSAPPALSRRIALAALLAATPLAAQEYPFGSTADTVFDIIRTDDPTAFVCLSYEGRTTRQMWDKRIDGESDLNVFLFQAHFSDGPPVDIILNPEFGSEGEARAEAMRYVRGLGQLPLVFRQGIRQFGVHKGDKGFHGGPGKIFMYHDRATRRIEQAHLEESILHESVHASLDRDWRQSPQWRAAQAKDPGFLTRYAAEHPEGEDLAETALFAYALLRYPGRIPPVDSAAIVARVPARIAVVAEILASGPVSAPAPKPPESCGS